MQCLRDTLGDGFDQGARFHHPTNAVAEFAEDLFGVVGFAEESAVEPSAGFFGHAADGKDGNQSQRNNDELLRTLAVLSDEGQGGQGDDQDGQHLQDADAILRQRVLQSLADDDADVHRALDDDDVGQGERKNQEHHEKKTDDPVRGLHARFYPDQQTHQQQRSQGQGGAPIKEAKPPFCVRRDAH